MTSHRVQIYPADATAAHYAILGLHGRNADGLAFMPFVRQMEFSDARWVLPSALYPSGTHDSVRWWYEHENDNIREIRQSREMIEEIIGSQIEEGIAAENIFLVGFSQGGVIAIDVALRYEQRLGGVVLLSGYIAHPDLLLKERHDANRRIPVFVAHGIRDEVLPIESGRANESILRKMHYDVEYHEYDTSHRISSAEMKDIRAFLHRHMYGIDLEDPRSRDEHIVPF